VNDVSAALHAAAVNRAARVLEGQKLQVLDRNWTSGPYHLDLVVTPGSDILAAVEVAIVTQSSEGASVATLTESRFQQVTDAVREWKRQREALFNDLWVILVTVDPAGGTAVTIGNAPTGVA
jgi:Holliday junction resolvase-like predicted endonuclease